MGNSRVAVRGWKLAVAATAMAGTVVGAQSGDADKIVGSARQALGGDKKLDAVQTIVVTGRTIRTMPTGNTAEGDFEMAMELPDKFVRRDVLAAMGNMSVYRVSGFNGDGVINEVDQPPQLAGGGNVVFRVVGPGMSRDGSQTPEQKEAARQAMLQSARRDFARFALGFFVKSTPAFPLALTSGGTAESPDGTADIVEVKGENFAGRLFIDTKTHLPLMLSWMDKEPLRIVRNVGGPVPGAGAGGAAAGSGGQKVVASGGAPAAGGQAGKMASLPPEEREKLEKDLAAQAKEAEAKRRTVEFRIFYSDYQAVDGVMIPHRIQSSVDGKPTDEITFEKVKVNQKVDPKRFTVSK
jgi:hypothetical protein